MNRRELLASAIAAALSAFTPRLSAMADAGTLQPSVSHSPDSMTVNVEADCSELVRILEECSSLVESGNVPSEVVDRFRGMFECSEQLFRIESDSLTAGAYKVIVRFYPSDTLLRFLAACRAGN